MPRYLSTDCADLACELSRLLVEQARDYAVFSIDLDGRIEHWSPGAEQLFGYREDEVIGESMEMLGTPEDRRQGVASVPLEVSLSAATGADERWYQCKDGSRIWGSSTNSPVRDRNGILVGWALVIQNRTELKQAEEELARHQQRSDRQRRVFDAALASMLDQVHVFDREHRLTYANEVLLELVGRTRDEVAGKHCGEVGWDPLQSALYGREIAQVIAAKRPVKGVFSLAGATGSDATGERVYEYRLLPVCDENGELEAVAGTTRDITDRRRSERLVQESEQRFRALMEQAPFSIQIYSPEGKTIRVNRAWEALWSIPFDPATPYRILDDPVWERIGVRHLIEKAFAGEPVRIPLIDYNPLTNAPYAPEDLDSRRWFSAVLYPLKDTGGKVREVVMIHEDTTDRKFVEEELRESERVSRFLAETSSTLAAMTNPDQMLRRAAEMAVPFFADWCLVDVRDPDGDELQRLAIVHPEPEKVRLSWEFHRRYPPRPSEPYGSRSVSRTGQSEIISDIDDATLMAATQGEDHLRFLRSLGLRSYIGVPVKARGRFLGVLAFVTAESGRTYDRGDLRLAEDLAHRVALAVDNASLYATSQEALREKDESLALLDTLQQNAPVGFAFVDRQFRYVRINDALAAIDGTTPEHHLGRTVQETVPMLWPQLEPLYRRVIEQGQPVLNVEVTGETAASPGQERHWLVSYYPVHVREEVVGVGVLVSDISERKVLENELRQQAKQLAQADKRKDEFLATLAHELRNPLAPIRNSLQILRMPHVDAATLEQTQDIMERQIHHLVRLVDDLLDVSRVMRGKVELRMEPVEISTVVARAVETAHPLIEMQGHHLEVSLPSDSLLLNADPVRLAQVIGNLLTNAAKYTEPGGQITITARRQCSEAVVSVSDTGIGIAPELLPHVFELFLQADHGTTRAQGGLGIGLTLVKNLVEMHDGTVEARSEGLGKGCEIVVRLPLQTPQREPAPEHNGELPERASSGRRLLVVDDNKDAATSLAMLLRLQGHEVEVAHDGPTALRRASEKLPDMIFLDIGMPGMDGYEVARRLRDIPGLKNTVLAAVTGWGQKDDRRRTAEAGFHHHLVKPPEPKALKALLVELQRSGD